MAGNANSGGRNRKTADLHLLQGTFRKDRHGDPAEAVEPPAGRPEPPGTLSKVARAEWDRMIVRLETNRALTIVDDAALYQYACLFGEIETQKGEGARLDKLSRELKDTAGDLDGQALVDAIGHIVTLQHIKARIATQLRQGHMAIRQYLVEFGMTPSARTRVKALPVAGEPKDAKRSRFFRGA